MEYAGNLSPTQNYQVNWLRRRIAVSDATAAAVVDLAFAGRIGKLGDQGTSLIIAHQAAAGLTIGEVRR